VAALGLGCALASTPAAVGIDLLETVDPNTHPVVSRTAYGVLAVGLAVDAGAALLLRRRVPFEPPWRAALAVWLVLMVLAFADASLARIAPFRFGLLSVALYATPAMLYAAALNARQFPTLTVCVAVASAVPLAAAYPLAAVQRHVAATQWTIAQGVDSRLLQVITVPTLDQERYQYNPADRRLTAAFDQSEGFMLPPIAVAEETVTLGTDPCAPVDVAEGDGTTTNTPVSCTPTDAAVWQLDLEGSNDAAYAVIRDGVTIALTGLADMAPQLRSALLRAHPATDADLFTRIDPGPFTVTDWILL
jgi:hypothetical protein